MVALKGLRCSNATGIAQQDQRALRQALVDVNRPDADTIVQAGINLSLLRAGEAERRLTSRSSPSQGTPIPTNDIWIAALVVRHQRYLFGAIRSRARHASVSYAVAIP